MDRQANKQTNMTNNPIVAEGAYNNTITQLETNGRIISYNNQLFNEIHSFYQTLFKSGGIKSELIDRYLDDIKFETVLTKEDASLYEGKITKEECNIILSEFKSNKKSRIRWYIPGIL